MESHPNNAPITISAEPSLPNGFTLENAAPNRSGTGSSTSSTVDPNWKEQNLLSLDGGGIRGYWSLRLLKRLMEVIAEEERTAAALWNDKLQADSPLRQTHIDIFWPQDCPPDLSHVTDVNNPRAPLRDDQKFLPVHYFDMICGSSTGGLIAIMLGRFRMTVADCLQEYENLGQRVFGKPRWISQRNMPVVPWPKYSARSLEKVFKDVTQRRCDLDGRGEYNFNAQTFPTLEGTCNVFVTGIRTSIGPNGITTRRAYLFRSYGSGMAPLSRSETSEIRTVNYGSKENMEIWQVARGATAAPLYFRAFKVNSPHDRSGTKYSFSDGGFGADNNPSWVGLTELETLHGHKGDSSDDIIGVVVNVGTAKADHSPSGGVWATSFVDTMKGLADEATNTKRYAAVLQRLRKENFWRFNDETGVSVDLDEWEPNGWFTPANKRGTTTLQKLENAFNKWALEGVNDKAIRACAKELVVRRRARTLNPSLWEQYATGAGRFQCRHPDCKKTFYTFRHEFNAHHSRKHGKKPNGSDYRDPDYTYWRYAPKEA